MAAGEYVSVRSQRDLYENELRKEQIELKEWPEEEQAELERIYQAKGLSEEESRSVASKLMVNPKVALDTLAREELGLVPSQLGSPVAAASSACRSVAWGSRIGARAVGRPTYWARSCRDTGWRQAAVRVRQRAGAASRRPVSTAARAARAVASACAANALAVAIPCHRVVRNDGSLGGYRWGVKRKRMLLAREASP